MKYQKQFEEFIKANPSLLGGNDLATQTEHYGIKLTEPEYASSHVLWLYGEFRTFMDKVTE